MTKERIIKAELKFFRASPKKVRGYLKELAGKPVEEAMQIFRFLNKGFARDLFKLLKSAVANAENKGLDKKTLVIHQIICDVGPTLKRYRAGHRGIAFPFRRKMSHIRILLREEKSLIKPEKKKRRVKRKGKEEKPRAVRNRKTKDKNGKKS